ncbi:MULTISPECIES: hypothetical protein [unclassified Embleya]|uniref:hypothetical protein n=1 Tax=unclassified Embleya TaxID=2699296 RepID=UPI0033F2DF60
MSVKRGVPLVLLLFALITGCAVDSGVRVAGKPDPVGIPLAPAPSGAGLSIDPVRVLREDSGVNAKVKAALTPSCGTSYPVVAQYLNAPGTSGPPVPIAVVSVFQCGAETCTVRRDVAAYVYRLFEDGRTERVFDSEEPGSRIEIGKQMLVLQLPVYQGSEPAVCPFGEHGVGLRWDGSEFVEDVDGKAVS